MRILITGASGFIGSHIAARLAAEGHAIIGATRHVRWARKRHPSIDWVEADFRTHVDWRLEGVHAVVNCVGVLQDGGRDSTRAAHVEGARVLFEACERAGVKRVIQISAVGADPEAGTAYARTKHEGDRDLMTRDLDWVVVKPSLVIARGVYGGTALIRGLAGIPFVTPLIETRGRFRPIHMRDLCDAISRLLAPDAPKRVVIEAAGPQEATLLEVVIAHRAWLGFGESRVWTAPTWLADLAFTVGDFLGAFGVRTSLKSTSRAQMAYEVGGVSQSLKRHLGLTARPYEDALNEEPASVQDRWHARLYFVKPVARMMLAAFWIATGVVCLTSGRDEAIALAREAGLASLDAFAADFGGAFDIAIGAALVLFARHRKLILAVMAGVSIAYLVALTLTLPHLWSDPLGRMLKLIPFFVLLVFMASVEDER